MLMVCAGVLLAPGLSAQEPAAPAAAGSQPAPQLSVAELEKLVGPIALYPDDLIAIVLPAATGQKLTFRYVFAHSISSTSADRLRAIVEDASGTRTAVWSRLGAPTDVDGAWRTASVSLDAFAGQTIHLRFEAVDGGPSNILEVELDDIRVTRPS